MIEQNTFEKKAIIIQIQFVVIFQFDFHFQIKLLFFVAKKKDFYLWSSFKSFERTIKWRILFNFEKQLAASWTIEKYFECIFFFILFLLISLFLFIYFRFLFAFIVKIMVHVTPSPSNAVFFLFVFYFLYFFETSIYVYSASRL